MMYKHVTDSRQKQNVISFEKLQETKKLLKGAKVQIFNFFSNFWGFWYGKKSHIFLIAHAKIPLLKSVLFGRN